MRVILILKFTFTLEMSIKNLMAFSQRLVSNLSIKMVFWMMGMYTMGVQAQQTTGTFNGVVVNSSNEPLEFVQVALTNQETGLVYGTSSDQSGYFIIPQLPPDNHYLATLSFIGYHTDTAIVAINLGKTTSINVILKEATFLMDEITISAGSKQLLDKKGSIGNEITISGNLINALPSKNRSLQDVTSVLSEANFSSFGGASARFNNLSIDGSGTNDILGYQESVSGAAGTIATGTPGALAGTQPIGFGAIKDISIKQTPFHVTNGNFTGASIDVITQNGTNENKAQMYSFVKGQTLSGGYVDGKAQVRNQFLDTQSGVSLGGPIIKNKLFFFTNIEFTRRDEDLLNAPGSNTSLIPLDVVQRISDTLSRRYGYDAGLYQDGSISQQSTKVFLRLDYSINKHHNLTLRGNFVHGFSDQLEWTNNTFNFGNQGYRHSSRNYNIVSELKSTLSKKAFNKLTISHSNVQDGRSFNGEVFPHLEINYLTTNRIFAGTYREASVFGSDLNTTQLTNNFSYYTGKHAFTLGTSLEFNQVEFRYLTAFNGRWQYNSIEDFFNNRPSRIRGVYNIENNDFDFNRKLPSADFNVMLGSIYLQDEWRWNPKLTLLLGLRADIQHTPTAFPLSEVVKNTPAFARFDNTIRAIPQLNPRLGFSYDLKADKSLMIRGGSGLFTSRIPFLWYAYVNYVSGTRYFNVDIRPTVQTPIIEDVSQLATLQPNIAEINLIDNNFRLPQDWKNSLAVDVLLDQKTTFTVEATYSKVRHGLQFTSINRKDSLRTFDGADQRSYYLATGNSIKVNSNFTDVFLLQNTHQGYRYTLTSSVHRSTTKYQGHFSYTYGMSKDITSFVRNTHAANFEWNQAIDANNPELTFSNFDLRHKFVTYHFYTIPVKSLTLKTGFFVHGRSGNPFTFVYAGDINRDGSPRNDLMYIPAKSSDINFIPIRNANNVIIQSAEQQWDALNAYIESNDYLRKNRGQYAQRNAARTPWNYNIDFRLVVEKQIGKKDTKIQITLDLFNVANLVNRNWGNQYFVSNVENASFSLLDFRGIVNNQPTFQFNAKEGDPWQIDPLISRWQGQLGIQLFL